MANWQRKSDYLLREIVKFSTYVDSLKAGQGAKDIFHSKRMEYEALGKGGVSPVDSGRMKDDRDVTPRAPQTAA